MMEGNIIKFTAVNPGVNGNNIAISSSIAGVELSGATLEGGADQSVAGAHVS